MCYEPLNVQNRMCELCTFSQIRSHIHMHTQHILNRCFLSKATIQALTMNIINQKTSIYAHSTLMLPQTA